MAKEKLPNRKIPGAAEAHDHPAFEDPAAAVELLANPFRDARIPLATTPHITLAGVAESVDAHDSKSCSFGSVGSSPTAGIFLGVSDVG